MHRFHRSILTAGLASALAVAAPAVSRSADVTVDADLVSAYVWRGITFNNDPVIEPSVDVAHPSGLGLNVWANFDLGDYDDQVQSGEFSEIDLTLTYAVPVESFDLSVGAVSYTFPQGSDNSHEVFVNASVEPLPGLTAGVDVYYDFDEVDDFYGSLSAAYAYELNEKLALEAGAAIGAAGSDFALYYNGTEESGFHDWNVSLTATYAQSEAVELGAFIAYTDSADSEVLPDQDVDVYGGASVSYTF